MTASDPRVYEIQARLDAATPGPWQARQDFIDGGVHDNSMTLNGGVRGDYIGTIALHYDVRAANAEFIAAAPADVAYLLAELRDRDEKLAKVNALHQRVEGYIFGAIPGAEPDYPVCSMCFTEDERPEPWPCATIAAVAAANGGGEQCLSVNAGRQCLLRPGHAPVAGQMYGHIYPAEDS